MKQSWEDYEKAAEHGPARIVVKVLVSIFVLSLVLTGVGYLFGWCGEAAQVAQKEFGPSALLKKYEWFKDASAQLDKKKADIEVYAGRIKSLEDAYKGVSRKDWPRDEREQMSVWQSEVAGVKASFNGLAAEYNSQMAKFNWAFTNAGSLPEGATQPLPREYKPYVEQ
jgi:hypothetical protein